MECGCVFCLYLRICKRSKNKYGLNFSICVSVWIQCENMLLYTVNLILCYVSVVDIIWSFRFIFLILHISSHQIN